jgi:uncharacterized protein GlcG (DUF336 family)
MTLRTAIQSASLMSLVSISLAQTPAAPPAQPPNPPRARGPNLALAVEAAQVTQATCLTNGYKVTVLVVDSAGVPVVMLSGDGAAERTQMVAGTKVAAAIRYNMSSGEVTERAKTDAKLAEEIKADPKIGMPRQGALLLKVGNDTIGAIAASGAPGGEKDEVCAQAGIDKIKGRLR